MKALNIGVTNEFFHDMYTLMQKRENVMVSRDAPIMKIQKYSI